MARRQHARGVEERQALLADAACGVPDHHLRIVACGDDRQTDAVGAGAHILRIGFYAIDQPTPGEVALSNDNYFLKPDVNAPFIIPSARNLSFDQRRSP